MSPRRSSTRWNAFSRERVDVQPTYEANLAWAATLATNYAVRSRIFGVFTGLGVVGAIAVLFIPVIMDKAGYSDGEGVRAENAEAPGGVRPPLGVIHGSLRAA